VEGVVVLEVEVEVEREGEKGQGRGGRCVGSRAVRPEVKRRR